MELTLHPHERSNHSSNKLRAIDTVAVNARPFKRAFRIASHRIQECAKGFKFLPFHTRNDMGLGTS
jgi:hypothetical protein